MPELLKEVYSEKFYNTFLEALNKVVKIDKSAFLQLLFDEKWKERELKDRMRHTTDMLANHLPGDPITQAKYLVQSISFLREAGIKDQGFEYMFIPDFVERKLSNQSKEAYGFIYEITKFVSCEFAIRPFIIKDTKAAMLKMTEWSMDQDENVRRLSSEGCRPRLPWAMALPSFKKDPSLILPILENLKKDSSEYVRRSVANNLNDISKDHPEVMIDYLKKWGGKTEDTDRLLKHAARTLLKAGNKDVMGYYGLSDKGVKVESFKVLDETVEIGKRMHFDVKLQNISKAEKNLRLEYAMSFKLKNGKYGKKVFKITENILAPGQVFEHRKYHDFKFISTRTYYPGIHKISLVVNGVEKDECTFELH